MEKQIVNITRYKKIIIHELITSIYMCAHLRVLYMHGSLPKVISVYMRKISRGGTIVQGELNEYYTQ